MKFFVINYFLLLQLLTTVGWADSRLEVSLSKDMAYVQQVLICSVKVISSQTVSIKNIDSPIVSNASLDNIDGPRFYSQKINGQTFSVTEYRYAVTPLMPRVIDIKSLTADISYDQAINNAQWQRPGYGNQYYNPWARPQKITKTIKSKQISINVKPVALKNTIWLPLYSLQIQGFIGNGQKLKEGEPISYTLVMDANGLKGADLPNLNSHIISKDFKLYFESATTTKFLSEDGLSILGKRTEKYTLVPKKSGKINLPSLKVSWWDLNNQREVWTEMPSTPIDVKESYASQHRKDPDKYTHHFKTALNYLTVLVLSLFLFIIGLWIGAGRPGKQSRHRHFKRTRLFWAKKISEAVKPGWYALLHVLALCRQIMSDNRYQLIEALWEKTFNKLPIAFKVMIILRDIKKLNQPEQLSVYLNRLTEHCLKLSVSTPNKDIGRIICQRYPCDCCAIVESYRLLDVKMFGQGTFEFTEWKSIFIKAMNWRCFIKEKNSVDSQVKFRSLNPSMGE
ncbi:MAG: hypothetical protein HON94_05560 [Methylococcales bacterium]|jgi:hypothetical protein|nr:hypothetical protein [Methylococcales bacterium]